MLGLFSEVLGACTKYIPFKKVSKCLYVEQSIDSFINQLLHFMKCFTRELNLKECHCIMYYLTIIYLKSGLSVQNTFWGHCVLCCALNLLRLINHN